MGDWHFHDAHAAGLELLHQLDTDGAAGGDEICALQEAAANEAEVTIDIAQFDAEEGAGELVIDGPIKILCQGSWRAVL